MTKRSVRVSAGDLSWAAEWIKAYEVDPVTPHDVERHRRVLDWLNAEVARRINDAVYRGAAKLLGTTPAKVRSAAKRRAERELARMGAH